MVHGVRSQEHPWPPQAPHKGSGCQRPRHTKALPHKGRPFAPRMRHTQAGLPVRHGCLCTAMGVNRHEAVHLEAVHVPLPVRAMRPLTAVPTVPTPSMSLRV